MDVKGKRDRGVAELPNAVHRFEPPGEADLDDVGPERPSVADHIDISSADVGGAVVVLLNRPVDLLQALAEVGDRRWVAALHLHRAFAERRVNMINQRREFFFATPAEVRTVLLEQVGNLLEFAEEPEATQYLQSLKYWPGEVAPSSGPRV